ncbi:MAG: response regulator, partial [Thermoguttaceae bacterium]
KDGSVVDCEWYNSSLKDGAGRLRSILSLVLDVTARRRAEASEQRLKTLMDHSPSLVFLKDESGRYVYLNGTYERKFVRSQDWYGKTDLDFWPEESARLFRADDAEVLQSGQMKQFVEDSRDVEGNRHCWLCYKFPLSDSRNERYVGGIGIEVTDRIRAEEALRENERQLRLLTDRAPVLLAHWDLEHRFKFANLAYTARFGLLPEQVVGRHLGDVVGQQAYEVIQPWLEKGLRGEVTDYEAEIPFAAFGARWMRAAYTREMDAGGAVVGIVAALQDITHHKLAEAVLVAAKAAAEAANVAKSQFLINMSHELRTPMNAIVGMTELALQEELSPRLRDYLQTSKHSADSLLELLNEILDFSRIESGRFELEAVPLNLRKTVEQVIKTLGVRAREKGLKLAWDVLPEVPEQFVGDPLRLRQILMNLVGNAIKFTDEGMVLVRVDAAERTGRAVVVHFSVCDTGIGIAPEDHAKIFAPFVQGDASMTRRYGGTGLGLSIVSHLVGLMGGRVWVKSSPGSGSTFHFTAELAVSEEPSPQDSAFLAGLPPLTGVPVLLVDDDRADRQILKEVLDRWGVAVQCAADVATALTMIHDASASGRPFRAVLAGGLMAGIDGITLAGWINRNPNLAGPVILMFSPSGRQAAEHRCAEVEAIYLEKPVSQSDLLAALMEALGIRPQSEPPRGVDGLLPPLARPLRVLLAEDSPANQKTICYILDKRGHSVEVAGNGIEALTLLGQHDFDAVLMDLQMPEMDGFQATRAIRASAEPKIARLPIIAVTAHALKEDAQRCLDHGMDACVRKPFKAKELISLVERLAEQRPDSFVGPALETAPTPTSPAFDLDQAVETCFGQYTMFQKMVECLFAESDTLLSRMRAALAEENASDLARAAHRLMGTVAYLGSRPVLDATERVECLGRDGNLAAATEAVAELEEQIAALKRAVQSHRLAGAEGGSDVQSPDAADER